MGKRFKDIKGKQFGRLTVLKFQGQDKDFDRIWLCRCSCGKKKICKGYNLWSGDVKSCGCLLREHHERWPKTFLKHGKCKSREYSVWCGMKRRCYCEKDSYYTDYGGRGITVCDRWKNSFAAFHQDMGECPKGMQIDRIDNSKGYSPENCRWVTGSQNCNNTRRNVILELNGEMHTLTEWGRKLGKCLQTLWYRRYHGWSDRDILLGRKSQ